MKKTLAVACFTFALCIPFIAKSQQQNQFFSLERLDREQLIQVINCLARAPSKNVDQCVNELNLSGQNAPIIAKLASIPFINLNSTSTTAEPVYSIDVAATDYAATLDTFQLRFQTESANEKQSENPAVLIKTIEIFVDETSIRTINVTPYTFVKNDKNEYFINFTGLNINIPARTQRRVLIRLETNNRTTDKTINIDSSPMSMKAILNSGIYFYFGIETQPAIRTHTFKANLNVVGGNLSVSRGLPAFESKNNQVDSVKGAKNVEMLNINFKSEIGSSQLQSIRAIASGTIPTMAYLYDGNNLIASTPGSNIMVFKNLNLVINKNTSKNFQIKADFASTNSSEMRISLLTVNEIRYQNTIGKISISPITINPNILSSAQFLMPVVVNFQAATTPVITTRVSQTSSTTLIVANFEILASVNGGNIPSFTKDQFNLTFRRNTNTIVPSATIEVVHISNEPTIVNGTTTKIVVTGTTLVNNVTSPGLYTAQIDNIKWNNGTQVINQNWGLNSLITPIATSIIR